MKTPLILLPLVLGSLAAVQGQVLIRVQQGNNFSPVANGGSVIVNSTGIGQAKTLQVTITYTGATSLSFPLAPQILGSQDFSITVPPSTTTLGPNQSLTMELRYVPTSSQLAQSELDYSFLQTAIQPANSPVTVAPSPGIVVLGLNGTAPEYSLSYSQQLDGNIVPVPAGGTLSFMDTVVAGSSLAPVIVVNRGSGSGQVLSAATTGDAFSVVSLPLLPSALPTGGNLQFQVRYRPRQEGLDSGTLTVQLEGGGAYTVNLSGRAIVSYLSYELLAPDAAAQPIVPGHAVTLPATAVGERSTVFIRMKNSSSLDISLSGVAISGSAYQLSDLPFLPLAMAPGDVQIFSVIFAPQEAGKPTGRLRIGNDSFDLTATAIGPILSYSYRNPAGVTAVKPLGTLVFPGVQVGQTTTVDFTIRNTGTAPAPLVSASIVSNGKSVYTLADLPTLPMAIEPGAALTFGIRFSPLNTGLSTASLRLNTDAFTLAGDSSDPAPLPDYTIQGPTTVQAFEQPSVSLTLASAYSVTLTGTLTLNTEPDSFVSDPSVQFANGSRVADFTIAAGSTSAVFSNGSTQLRFQTGSVAGSIFFTPSFASEGGLDLTPSNPKRLQVTLAASTPRLVSLSVDSRTSTGFVLQAVGVTTSRSLAKLAVSFKGKPGYNFPQTEFTQDLTGGSFLWFNSTASTAFGGQFVISFPFSLSSSDTSSSATPPIQAIESVTLTVTNDKGTSNSLTALIQ